jgi:hypothetical protein
LIDVSATHRHWLFPSKSKSLFLPEKYGCLQSRRLRCGAAGRATIRGKRRIPGTSVDRACAAARPKPQRGSVFRDHFCGGGLALAARFGVGRSARSGKSYATTACTAICMANRASVIEQRLAVKSRSRLRVICATPFQKRPDFAPFRTVPWAAPAYATGYFLAFKPETAGCSKGQGAPTCPCRLRVCRIGFTAPPERTPVSSDVGRNDCALAGNAVRQPAISSIGRAPRQIQSLVLEYELRYCGRRFDEAARAIAGRDPKQA